MWQQDKAVKLKPKINSLVGVFGWLKKVFCWLYPQRFTQPTKFCFFSAPSKSHYSVFTMRLIGIEIVKERSKLSTADIVSHTKHCLPFISVPYTQSTLFFLICFWGNICCMLNVIS